MASKPDQVGAAGDQFDSDQEVTTSSAAEELQRRNSWNSVVEILKTNKSEVPLCDPDHSGWATSQLWVVTVSACLLCFVFDTLVTGGAVGQQEGGGRGQVRWWHQHQLLHGVEGGKLLQPKTRRTATTTQSALNCQRERGPRLTAKPKVNALNFFFFF